MESGDPGMVNERNNLDEGLRILARIIARRHRRDIGESGTRQGPDHAVASEGPGQHNQAGNEDAAA